MKFEIEIKAVLTEKDPSYRGIVEAGLEKATENIKKMLMGAGVDSLDVNIKEVRENSQN